MTEPIDRGQSRVAKARAFWGRRGKWGKAAIIILAVLVALTILGALLPSESDDTASTTTTETVATETQSQATETETEEPKETEPADTGRMSDTEYATFTRLADDFDGELTQYGEVIGRCGVLIQALELAAASECVDEAWGGVWDSAQSAWFNADDLVADTAKGCQRALRAYRTRLDLFSSALKQSTEAGINLNFEEFNSLAPRANRLAKPYGSARDKAHRVCAPA